MHWAGVSLGFWEEGLVATVKDCIGRCGFRLLFWVNMGWGDDMGLAGAM